ncbi:MAG: hypothetical protein M9932_02785 [Xanthobacteraceae bacterium]|nr:hypothetical protein [Xanthobacteraceae bacterium]
MLGEMEKGFNSFATQTMSSPEFSKVMNQAGGVAAGAQKQFEGLMEKYLVGMNLPSRTQLVSMAERLQAIEAQLNEIRTLLSRMMQDKTGGSGEAFGGLPKPRRTRRPPSAAGGTP